MLHQRRTVLFPGRSAIGEAPSGLAEPSLLASVRLQLSRRFFSPSPPDLSPHHDRTPQAPPTMIPPMESPPITIFDSVIFGNRRVAL